MGCDASQGFQSKLAMKLGTAGSINWASGASLMEIQSETIKKASTLVNTAGLRGTRARTSSRTREGTFAIGGTITLNPSPRDFDILLPMAGFSGPVSQVYSLSETLSDFGVIVDRSADIFEYENCLCSGLTIKGSEGSIVDMTFDLVSDNEDIAGAPSWPTLTFPTTSDANPFMFFDAALVIGGTTYQMNSFEISIQHTLDIKYRNSQKPTSFCPTDRVIMLKVNTPYTSDELGLYPTSSNVSGSVTLTNGTVSTLFTFPHLRTPNKTPTVPGRSEITLDLELQAFATGTSSSTLEMQITNDSTV